MICGSTGSKSRLAKAAAGAEPAGQMRDYKLHAVVAWSTFRSQNVQSTLGRIAGFPVASPCLSKNCKTYPLYTLHPTLYTPHFTLDTLRSTLYTLHPALYNLISTLHTWHSRLHTLHVTLYTLRSTLYTLYTLYTPRSTLHTLHFTLDTLHSTLYTPHVTLYTPHFTLYTLHSTLCAPHFTLYIHFTLHALHSTLYTLHLTLYTPHFTLYTLHSTLYAPHFTLYTHFTLHTLHSTLYTLDSTLYTLHSTLRTLHSMLHAPRFTLHTLHFRLFPKRQPDPEKNKKHFNDFNVQNGLLHYNGRYGFQNVAKSKKKTHLGKQNASSRMLRQTMQHCNGEVQVMNSPYSSTKATLLWREGNLGVLGCGVTRWQSRNCKKTRVKLYPLVWQCVNHTNNWTIK